MSLCRFVIGSNIRAPSNSFSRQIPRPRAKRGAMSLTEAEARSYARSQAHQTFDYWSALSQTKDESATQQRAAASSGYATEQRLQNGVSSGGANLDHIPQKRVALDGCAYTEEEFCDYYGAKCLEFWTYAAVSTGQSVNATSLQQPQSSTSMAARSDPATEQSFEPHVPFELSDELWNHTIPFLTIESGWYFCFDEESNLCHSHICCNNCDASTRYTGDFKTMSAEMRQHAFYGCDDCRTIRALIVVSKNLKTLVQQKWCDDCGCILANSARRAVDASVFGSTYCIPCGKAYSDLAIYADAYAENPFHSDTVNATEHCFA